MTIVIDYVIFELLFINNLINMRTKEGNKEIDILEAAIKVFAESGFHKAKISTIAEEAKVATGSVYLYYKNKNALLNKIFVDFWSRMYNDAHTLQKRTDLNNYEKLDALIDLLFDSFSQNPKLAIVVINEQHHVVKGDEITAEFFNKFLLSGENIIKDGIKDSIINPNINVEVLRHFLLGSIRYLLDHWAKFPQSITIHLIRQNVKQIIKKGILL